MSEPDFSMPQRRASKMRLAGNGGGGDDDGMLDRRVAALETDVREMKVSLGRIERVLEKIETRLDRLDERFRKVEMDVTEVKGRVSNSPTTFALVTTGFGMVFTTATLILAIVRFGLPR